MIYFSKYQDKITIFLNYLLVLYTFLLPFNTNYSNILFDIILILFFFSGEIKEKLLFALNNKLIQAILLFYAMYLLWSFSSQHIDWMIWKLKEFKYLFYIIIFLTIIKEEFKEKILGAFIISVFISEIISYLMFFNFPLSFIHITGYGKLVPFFYTYSQYVLLVLIATSFLLYQIINNNFENLLFKFFTYFFFILSSILVFLLDSKLGYILYAIIFIVIFFYIKRDLFNKKYFIGSLLLLIILNSIAFFSSSTFKSRATNMYMQTKYALVKHNFTGSTGQRLAWNIVGLEIYIQHPILGVGGFNHIDLAIEKIENMNGSDETKSHLLKFKNTITPYMQTLHNEYLDHMIQFGIIGLLILVNIFYSIYKLNTNDEKYKVLKIILLTIFLPYLFVNYFFVLTQLGIIFFLLTTLTLTTYDASKIKTLTRKVHD